VDGADVSLFAAFDVASGLMTFFFLDDFDVDDDFFFFFLVGSSAAARSWWLGCINRGSEGDDRKEERRGTKRWRLE